MSLRLENKFTKEKKALVPDRDYVIGHPLEDQIRKRAFKRKLEKNGADLLQHFNAITQTTMRTIVSKTYTDMFKTLRWTVTSEMSAEQREQHADWMFEELEKYQQEAKKLVLKHFKEWENG